MVPQPYLPFILHLFLHAPKTDFQVTECNGYFKILILLDLSTSFEPIGIPSWNTLFLWKYPLWFHPSSVAAPFSFPLRVCLLLLLLLLMFFMVCWWALLSPLLEERFSFPLVIFLSLFPLILLSLFWSNFILYHDLNSLYILKSLKFISVAQCSFLSFRWEHCTMYLILLLKCLVDISNTWVPNLPPNICPFCRILHPGEYLHMPGCWRTSLAHSSFCVL